MGQKYDVEFFSSFWNHITLSSVQCFRVFNQISCVVMQILWPYFGTFLDNSKCKGSCHNKRPNTKFRCLKLSSILIKFCSRVASTDLKQNVLFASFRKLPSRNLYFTKIGDGPVLQFLCKYGYKVDFDLVD